ncbi:MAG: BON domain-containing protein [Burkholderiaceae bacterium]
MTLPTPSPRLPLHRAPRSLSLARALVAAAAAATLLGACAPLLIGGAMLGTAMVVTDRRSSGTQIDDQGIELKAINVVNRVLGDRGHVNVTSFNRLVLVTGEVPTEADKAAVESAITRIENVHSIVNELAVAGASSLTSRSNDTLLTSKVKASLIDAKDLQAHAFKVVTERGVVYLMGRVTEREAKRASDVARGVSGVQKVVRVFELVTEAELADLKPKPAAQ